MASRKCIQGLSVIISSRTSDPQPSVVRLQILLSLTTVLVDGQLWTDESVFWQNRLVDGKTYEVIYRLNPFLL